MIEEAVSINAAVTMRPNACAPLGRIDQYELIRELGKGGFGCVYLAKDTVSGVHVAVKGLPPFVHDDKTELENIKRNFALVARLTQENIAKALVLHPANEVVYRDEKAGRSLRVRQGDTLMVMEYAPGVTLAEWRNRYPDGRVPVDEAADVLAQVAAALDFAHVHNILHRDIKPQNVMVESRSDGGVTARVLDFGLAAEIRSSMSRVSLQVTDTSGTRPYMAPEQWQGRRQGEATDQYALAVMACELLTGKVPFASVFGTGDPMVMMAAVTTRDPEFEVSLPSPAEKALRRALSKKAEDRFASCGDFVAALCGGKTRRKRVRPAGGSGMKKVVLPFLALALAGSAAYGVLTWRGKMAAEREAALKRLKVVAVELKIRATQAYDEAARRRFDAEPELAGLLREFNRHYRSGMEFFANGDYVAATNAFEKTGAGMKAMADGKRHLEAERARLAEEARLKKEREEREAELKRLVARGYVRRGDTAVWEEGTPHGKNAALVADREKETWRSVKTGYRWDGQDGLEWVVGLRHPDCPHWVSSSESGMWRAESGYRPDGDGSGPLPLLKWVPGTRYADFRAAATEGTWESLVKCDGCGGAGQIVRRKTCSVCGGTARTSARANCSGCNGSGNIKASRICGSCNGARQISESCTASGSLITRNGGILFKHGTLCSTCGGKGTVFNTAGVLGNALLAGFSKGRYGGTAPSVVMCANCSGLGAFMCGTCNGTGQVLSSCRNCGATGMTTDDRRCAACDGSGKTTVRNACANCQNGNVAVTEVCSVCVGAREVWRGWHGALPASLDVKPLLKAAR